MRIAFAVGVRMMAAVRRDPGDWSALQRENAEEGEEVLDRLWHLQAAMREQAVIAEGDADAPRDVTEDEENANRAPGEECRNEGEQCNQVDAREREAGTRVAAAARGGRVSHGQYNSKRRK